MIFINPTQKDIPSLRRLWTEAFGDSDAFLDSFFGTAFSPLHSRIAKEGDRLAAMLYIFDSYCKGQKLAYIYAVATDKKFQNKGVCRALLQDTHTYLKENGYTGAILVPADSALSAMYAKFGYKAICDGSQKTIYQGCNNISLKKITAKEYERLREEYLPDGAVLQTGVSLEFLEHNAELYKGDGFLLAAEIRNSCLIAEEFLGEDSRFSDILFTLKIKKGVIKTPHSMYLPFFPNSTNPTYFGLSFQ